MSARRYLISVLTLFTLACAGNGFAANTSGLPLPRFVSLKSDEVNVRTGPGMRYPIQWVYRRTGMPVEVIEEYGLWRKIRDIEGSSGWVHKNLLDGKRMVMIKGSEPRMIKNDPETDAKNILKTEPMVTAQLMECDPEWCRIQISGRKGWIEKIYLWGVYPSDIIE